MAKQLDETRRYFLNTPFEESSKVMNARYQFKATIITLVKELEILVKTKVTCEEERILLKDASISLEVVLDNFEDYNCNIDAITKKDEVLDVKSS